jgi:trimeric autotransporter adhesin
MEPRHFTSVTRMSVVITAMAALLGIAPRMHAVSPAPDGGYPGNNTAEGTFALSSNTTGINNTAVGFEGLFHNTNGSWNSANGSFALFHDTSGYFNTGAGFEALYSNTIGTRNTAVGAGALLHLNGVVGAGNASSNIAVGFLAGSQLTTGSFNIDIGSSAASNDTRVIRIGTQGVQQAALIAGIAGTTLTSTTGVCVDTTTGQLGECGAPSSARFKEDIKPMDKESEAILALKPVMFRYKKEVNPTIEPQFGLIAEEVEKINRDLVKYDKDGKIFGVRYEAVNAMLLNEFLKQH